MTPIKSNPEAPMKNERAKRTFRRIRRDRVLSRRESYLHRLRCGGVRRANTRMAQDVPIKVIDLSSNIGENQPEEINQDSLLLRTRSLLILRRVLSAHSFMIALDRSLHLLMLRWSFLKYIYINYLWLWLVIYTVRCASPLLLILIVLKLVHIVWSSGVYWNPF